MKRLVTAVSVMFVFGICSLRAAERAPDFSLSTLDGKTISLASMRGKVVFLDFWASWCPPCRSSIPYVEKLSESYADKEVVFLGVNVEGDPEAAAAFTKKQGMHYPVLIGDAAVSKAYRVQGIPAFFIIGPKGTIEGKYVGFTPGTETEWAAKINALLPAAAKRKRPERW